MSKPQFMLILHLALFSFSLSATIHAESESANQADAEAEKLLVNTNTEALLKQTIDQQLLMLIQSNPRLALYKTVFTEFYNKHLSYESLKADLVKLYTQAFTTEELVELNTFYESPIGKKSIQKFPKLMLQAGNLAAQKVQSNLPELQSMLAQAAQNQ